MTRQTPVPRAGRPAARSAWLLAIVLIGAALSGGTLSACGQKGQLYLPSQKKSKVPPNPQPQNTPPPGTTPAPPAPGAS